MDSELLNVREVAKILGICSRQCWKMSASGKMPAPVRLGRCVRWRRFELESWIAGGCLLVEVKGGKK